MLSILFVTVSAFAANLGREFENKPFDQRTIAESCSDYDFAEERQGLFKNVEFISQLGDCNGSGHTQFAVTLIARDPKTKKSIDLFEEEVMDDGAGLGPIKYQDGVFLLGSLFGNKVVSFNFKTRKFETVSQVQRSYHEEEPKETKPQDLVGPTYETTVRKLADYRKRDCKDVDRVGNILETRPEIYEEAQLIAVHESADELYKAGKKHEAAQLVLRYLGDPGSEAYEFMGCEKPGSCSSGEEPPARADDTAASAAQDKLQYSVIPGEYDSGFTTPVSYSRVREWNDLAFYLMQDGYKAPAVSILEWVVAADPERGVASKNLKDARAMKTSRATVFDKKKFGLNEEANLKALKAWHAKGGQLVWHYGSFERLPIEKKLRELFIYDTHVAQDCGRSEGDTLLDLALMLGQTTVADYLWDIGFDKEILKPQDLWWSAVRRHKTESANWLVAHSIGIGDERSLLAIFDADDLEAYKVWASASPHAKALTEKLIYWYKPPTEIFEYLFAAKSLPYIHDGGKYPTLLFVLVDEFTRIKNIAAKVKQVAASGVSVNVLNANRETALDFALKSPGVRGPQRLAKSERLMALGAKTGQQLLKEGKRAPFSERDFPPNAFKAFEKAVGKNLTSH